MPDDRGHSSHHGHSRDLRTFLAFDLFEPGPQGRIGAEDMLARLAEHPAGHSAARFGDMPQPLVVLATVTTAIGSRLWLETFWSACGAEDCADAVDA